MSMVDHNLLAAAGALERLVEAVDRLQVSEEDWSMLRGPLAEAWAVLLELGVKQPVVLISPETL